PRLPQKECRQVRWLTAAWRWILVWRGESPGSSAEEKLPQGDPGFCGTHEGLTDEKRVNIVVTHELDIVRRQDATFRDDAFAIGHGGQQVDGRLQRRFERAQIAVINAQQRGFEFERNVE